MAEYAATILVGTLIAAIATAAWDAYQSDIRPLARVVPTFTPTPIPNPEKARADARRLRQILDGLGAANAYRAAGQRDWAIERYRDVLQLDPGNPDAVAGLRDLRATSPPTPTAAPPKR